MTQTVIHGDSLQGVVPDWKPLLDLLSDQIEDFMWMFEVELDDRTRVQAYKHIETRRYVHLSQDGRAFVYCGANEYREEDPHRLLGQVLERRTP